MLSKVFLEISNCCNLSCAFCHGTSREKRMMTMDEFDLLARKLQGKAQYLYFHLMGEPLLHPALAELLDATGRRGFKVVLTTNGVSLPKSAEALLSAPALHRVNISLQSWEANSRRIRSTRSSSSVRPRCTRSVR